MRRAVAFWLARSANIDAVGVPVAAAIVGSAVGLLTVWIVASVRCGSLSPTGPVSMFSVRKDAFFTRLDGAGDDEFRPSGRWDQDVGLRQCRAFDRAVLGADGHAVEADHLERLRLAIILQLQVEDGVRRGIRHAPELLLAGLHLDDGGSEAPG